MRESRNRVERQKKNNNNNKEGKGEKKIRN